MSYSNKSYLDDPNPYDEQPEHPMACLNPHCRETGYDRFQCSRCGADRCGGCVSEAAAEFDACEECASSVAYDLKGEVRKLRGELQQALGLVGRKQAVQASNLVRLTPEQWESLAASLRTEPHRAA